MRVLFLCLGILILECFAYAQGIPPVTDRTVGSSLPNVTLTDAQGRDFPLHSLKGKPLILSPIYAGCPSACIVISSSLKAAVESLSLKPDQCTVLSFTFDPKEKQEAIRSFRQKHQLNQPLWHIAYVKNPKQLFKLLDAIDFRFTYVSEEIKDHPNLLVFTDSNLTIRHYEFGLEFTPDQIQRGLRIARGELNWWERVQKWVLPVGLIGFFFTGLYMIFKRPPSRKAS